MEKAKVDVENEYPKMLYWNGDVTKQITVNSQEEEDALGSEWLDKIVTPVDPDAPKFPKPKVDIKAEADAKAKAEADAKAKAEADAKAKSKPHSGAGA